MAEAVVLGDLELDHVTGLLIDESRKIALHRWPGADGDIIQDLGMAAARIRLTGLALGEQAGSRLEQLRNAMQAGETLDFAASAAVASNIEKVLIAAFKVVQPPGRSQYFEYEMDLIRYVPPPPPPPAAGFDLPALDEIDTGIIGSALDSVTDAAAALGSAQEALSAIDDVMEIAGEVVAAAEKAGELLQGLGAIEKILNAASSVIKAGAG